MTGYRPKGLSNAQVVDWLLDNAVKQPAPDDMLLKDVWGPCLICHLSQKSNGQVNLKVDGKTVIAPRFVYEQCKRKLKQGQVVRHRCDRRACISPKHLLSGSYDDNSKDMVRRNRQARGERQHKAKLTRSDVKRMRSMHETGLYTHAELAGRFGVTRGTATRVVNRKNWAHVA